MKINVTFDVPAAIAKGLANGVLERNGGVIVFTDTKQIVAWLQESGNMTNHAAKGLGLISGLLFSGRNECGNDRDRDKRRIFWSRSSRYGCNLLHDRQS